MARETELVKAILDYLVLRGVFAWRQNQGGVTREYKGRKRFVRFARVDGISDIIGILPDGRFLALEAKVGNNKVTVSQSGFLGRIQDSGGVARVVRSVQDVIDVLQENTR